MGLVCGGRGRGPARRDKPGLQFLAPPPFTVATSTGGFQAKMNHICVIFDGALGAVCGSLTHTQPVTVLVCHLCFAFSSLPQHCSPSAESIPAALTSGYLLLGSRAGIINAKLIQAGAGPCFGETPQPENGPVIKAVTICLT